VSPPPRIAGAKLTTRIDSALRRVERSTASAPPAVRVARRAVLAAQCQIYETLLVLLASAEHRSDLNRSSAERIALRAKKARPALSHRRIDRDDGTSSSALGSRPDFSRCYGMFAVPGASPNGRPSRPDEFTSPLSAPFRSLACEYASVRCRALFWCPMWQRGGVWASFRAGSLVERGHKRFWQSE